MNSSLCRACNMQIVSLPASMQQELAARALRACMAAEAALASLRAECKPLQTRPQQVLALKKNMGNAHRSLRLQIEACESFSLSATAAFKQLCDVFFNADSGNLRIDNNDRLSPPETSISRFTNLATHLDEEIPDGIWRPDSPVYESASSLLIENDADKGKISTIPVKASASVRVDPKVSPVWTATSTLHPRMAPLENDHEATNSSGIASTSRSTEDWLRDCKRDDPHLQQEVTTTTMEECRTQDTDASESDAELKREISSLRKNSTIGVNSMNRHESSTHCSTTRHGSRTRPLGRVSSPISCDPSPANIRSNITKPRSNPASSRKHSPASRKSVSDSFLRQCEKENHLTQFSEVYTNQNVDSQDPPETSSQQRTDKAPDTSSDARLRVLASSDDEPPTFQNALQLHGTSDQVSVSSPKTPTLLVKQPSLSCIPNPPACDEARGLTQFSTQSPQELVATSATVNVASQLNPSLLQSSNTPRPSETQNEEILNPVQDLSAPYQRVASYISERTSFLIPDSPQPSSDSQPFSSSDPPATYSSRPPSQNSLRTSSFKPSLQAHFPSPSESFTPGKIPHLPHESLELVLTLPPSLKKDTCYTPSSSQCAGHNPYEKISVPLTPSPYTLKSRSTFGRASTPSHMMIPDLPASPSMQAGREPVCPSLVAMATALSVSPSNCRPTGTGRMSEPSCSPAYIPTMERQVHNLPERPAPHFSISPLNSTISSSSSSWETTTSSGKTGSDKSKRESSIEYYMKECETLQEQFPRAHVSFQQEYKSFGPSPSLTVTSKYNTRFSSPSLPYEITDPPASNTFQSMRGVSRPVSPQRPPHFDALAVNAEMDHKRFSYSSNGNYQKHTSVPARVTGGGFTQGHAGDLRGLQLKATLGSHIGDGGTQGTNFSATTRSNSIYPDKPKAASNGFKDVVGKELNKIEFSQELSNWPSRSGLKWDADSFDDEDGGTSIRNPELVVVKVGTSCPAQALGQNATDSDDDEGSLGTEREWHTILAGVKNE